MMYLPNLAGPVVSQRSKVARDTPEARILPADGGTCSCNYRYGPICTSTGGCAPGYYAECVTNIYGCGCNCKPG